jgi:hypothetical protein
MARKRKPPFAVSTGADDPIASCHRGFAGRAIVAA